jgi:serine/threonine protein kinase
MQRLELLEYLVRDLEDFFPPPGPSSDICGAVLVNPALMAEKDDWKLRWLSSQTEMDPFAASLAWLKATTISHINDVKLFPGYNPQRLHGMLIRDRRSTAARHYTGHYNGSPVLIEKKTVPSKANNDLIRPRIEKVVHLLQASQRIQELRTLPCIGYVYTQPGEGPLSINDENCTYEFLYTIHAGPAVSLREILSSESRKESRKDESRKDESRKDNKYETALSVGKRFEIARTLSRALLYLHAAEWLHKGIRSSSIMFVSSGQPISKSKETNTSQLGLPYLVGFEYSRLASNDEGTENHATTVEDNLYRHPDAQGLETTDEESYISRAGRFTKDHDIYSLGVTLVEMGVYKSAKRIAAEFKENSDGYALNAESFCGHMTDTLIPEVTFNMGEVYARVALRCLKPDFYSLPGRNSRDGSIAFYKEVVSQLELCRA